MDVDSNYDTAKHTVRRHDVSETYDDCKKKKEKWRLLIFEAAREQISFFLSYSVRLLRVFLQCVHVFLKNVFNDCKNKRPHFFMDDF